jgi:membrane protein involved in colicin uptake
MAVKKAFYNIIDLKGNQIQGVGAPSADTDAATKISAQGQADAAEAAAIAAAALDATSKADAAEAAAIAAAALDATSKADAAEAAAIAAAALDATSKADAAEAAAATYTDDKITNLVNGAPAVLDTLNELAAALGNDENFSTTITTLIGTKASIATGLVTGDGTSTADGYEYTVTHSLGKADVLVQVYDGNDVVEVFVRKVNNNSLKIITGAALGSTSLSVVVVG